MRLITKRHSAQGQRFNHLPAGLDGILPGSASRLAHDEVTERIRSPPGALEIYSSWSRRHCRVRAKIRETCICDTPIRSAIWLCVIDSKNRM